MNPQASQNEDFLERLGINGASGGLKPVFRLAYLMLTAGLMSCLISCDDGFDLVPDPKEVVEIPGYNGEGSIQPVRINNQNQIIGYTGGAELVGFSLLYTEREAAGFLINSDGSGFRDLRQEDHLFNWPLDINEQGLIAGAFTPEGNYTGDYVPAYAYAMQSDGTGFTNLHPEGAFFSIARKVTPSGTIAGEYGRSGTESIACLFRGDSIVELVNPQVQLHSTVQCANDQAVIIYSWLGEQRYAYYAFDLESETLERLNIDERTADFSELFDITEDGLAVGFYIDLNVNELAIGMTYDLRTDKLKTYNQKNKQDKSEYLEYTFFGVNASGLMVGRSGRTHEGGLLQSRAMKMNNDFTGFRDITPENSGIYSEMYSVNDAGLAVGYLGLPRKNTAVVNKMFVMQLD